MPTNKEMVGKALGRNKNFKKGVLTLPSYDPDKEYKLHITKIEKRAGGVSFGKIKVRGGK